MVVSDFEFLLKYKQENNKEKCRIRQEWYMQSRLISKDSLQRGHPLIRTDNKVATINKIDNSMKIRHKDANL